VARTLSASATPLTDAEMRLSLQTKIMHWLRHGFGLWLMRDRATGEVVGRGGVQHTLVPGTPEVEVGWSIVPERWNQGLATELAVLSVGVAFEDLGLERIVAFTLPENIASRRVMEKSGFNYEREFDHVGIRHALYRQLREDWAARAVADRSP
jgi:ribosomal-protein-alanine N-acetyltransferase